MAYKLFSLTINPIVRFISLTLIRYEFFLIFFILVSSINNKSRILILIPKFFVTGWLRVTGAYSKFLIHGLSKGCGRDTVPNLLWISRFYMGSYQFVIRALVLSILLYFILFYFCPKFVVFVVSLFSCFSFSSWLKKCLKKEKITLKKEKNHAKKNKKKRYYVTSLLSRAFRKGIIIVILMTR